LRNLSAAASFSFNITNQMPPTPQTLRIRPPALQRGEVVGIVAPASNIKREQLDAGCQRLHQLGYQPFYLESILEQDLYFAGPVERRARELEEMFARDEVRAIVCARGGYGANYLLRMLDLRKISRTPKIFVGYSDITTLLTWFADAAGFVTFHGPMVTKDFAREDGVDLGSWEAALCGASEWSIEPQVALRPLQEGFAQGVLYGGCLSMLAASLGTPFEIRTAGAILFIEDIAAKPFQIDRMLMQLKLAGKFKEVRGFVFGEMIDCIQYENQEYSLEEVIMRVIGDLGVPVAYGLRSGHVPSGNITLPIGVRAELAVGDGDVKLKFVEPATTATAR
jgi:muramoyltetrapeptide carboxypeptidase